MNLLMCNSKHINNENVYVFAYCNIKNLSCKSGANNK